MKTQTSHIRTGWHYPEVEEYISKQDAPHKEQMNTKGKRFAQSNRPAPVGDNYHIYIGEAKAGYERVLAKVQQMLQPDSQAEQAKIENNFLRGKVEALTDAINISDNKIINAKEDLEKHGGNGILFRLLILLFVTLLISSGETFFATDSLQVLGGNLLFSMFISISISVALMVAAHVIPILYKEQPTVFRKRLVLIISTMLVIGVFSGLAFLRSEYLSKQGIEANPLTFIMINLFLFGACTLFVSATMPEWGEIKRYFRHLTQYSALAKLKKENLALKAELHSIITQVEEKAKERANLCDYAKYVVNTIKALYRESAEMFKSANLASRTDGKTPDCFSQSAEDLEIDQFINNFKTNQT